MAIDEAERKQDIFNGSLSVLEIYPAYKKEYIEAKNKLLNSAKKLKGLKMEYFRWIMMKKKNTILGIKKKKRSEMKMVSLIMKSLRD